MSEISGEQMVCSASADALEKDDRSISLMALDQYRREVNRLRQADHVVTAEEKLLLLQRVVRANGERGKACPNQWLVNLGKHARDRLIELHQAVVFGCAYRMFYRTHGALEVLDFVSEANMALLRLLDHNLPDAITVATFYVLASKYMGGAMLAALQRVRKLTGRSQSMMRKSFALKRMWTEASLELGYEPSYQELAEKMGLSVQEVCALVESEALEQPMSLEELIEDCEGGDAIQGAMTPLVVEESGERGKEGQRAQVRRALDEVLTDRQREVLRFRYGIDEAEYTQAEAARVLGWGVGTVVHHEKRALEVLRQVVEGEARPVRLKAGVYVEHLEGMYTAPQAARVLGVCEGTVRSLARQGKLAGTFVPSSSGSGEGAWLLSKEAVDARAVEQKEFRLRVSQLEGAYTIQQAARVLGVCEETVRSLARRGKLPGEFVKSSESTSRGVWLLAREAVDARVVARRVG